MLGIGVLAAGFIVGGRQGVVMIVTGLALCFLGGTEVSIREHFAGYKSHSMLLAGVVAVLATTILFLLVPSNWPRPVPFGTGAVIFGACFYLFRESFKRRSGGLGFRGGLR